MQHPSKPSWFVVTILLLALAACSQQPGICSVEGVVRFPDGQPLTEGTVAFEAVDHQPRITATGEIGPGGTFRLGTYGVDDGAVPG